jgi:hypothetical protein
MAVSTFDCSSTNFTMTYMFGHFYFELVGVWWALASTRLRKGEGASQHNPLHPS